VWTLDAGDVSGLVRVFSLLRENDVKFASKIVDISRNYDRKDIPNANFKMGMTIANFNDTFLAGAVTPFEAWNTNLAKLNDFIATNGRWPKKHREANRNMGTNSANILQNKNTVCRKKM
jgi:hypothetical protein